MNEHIIQKTTKDGKYRVTVNVDDFADNPLGLYDDQLYVCDWSRKYSIMRRRDDRDFESARELLEYLLRWYGDCDKIIERLICNGKEKFHNEYDTALIYDNHTKQWNLKYWVVSKNESHWSTLYEYNCKRSDLDVFDILYEATDECISDLAWNCMTDEVKILGYTFGYYGSIVFHDNYSCESNGIAYLIKKESVGKDNLFTEEQWNANTCMQLMKPTLDEIESWAEGCVYCYNVEKLNQYRIHKACLTEQKPMKCYTDTEWEEIDTCYGFYGDPEYAFEYALDNNNLKKEDFDD